MPTRFQYLIDEALPLIAKDLRSARVGLGITSATAAKLAELDPAIYSALEECTVARNVEKLGVMMSASRCLGLEAVRFSYVDEVQQYLKVDLSLDRPLTVFVDTLRLDVRDLKEQSVSVSPYHVLALVERIGFYETFASRQRVDKQLVELWIAAVFSLSLGSGRDYYVGLSRDDPPDVVVLAVDGIDGRIGEIAVEITQHGSHSNGLFDVIRKKLLNRYRDGTVLVVLVEQAEDVPVGDLDEFIRRNNPHSQRIFIIGGSAAPGTLKVVPLDGVNELAPSEIEWAEIRVDAKNASKGYRGYEGVVFKPPGSWFLPRHPVFVRGLELHR